MTYHYSKFSKCGDILFVLALSTFQIVKAHLSILYGSLRTSKKFLFLLTSDCPMMSVFKVYHCWG